MPMDPHRIARADTHEGGKRVDGRARSKGEGDYFITDHTKDPTHPKTVQPRRRFNKNIASLFLCSLAIAIKKGKK